MTKDMNENLRTRVMDALCEYYRTLEEVAQENLDKLASRAKRGVIDGNGDNR